MKTYQVSTPSALILSAVIIGGVLGWQSEMHEAATVCAGFLSSNTGATALENLATFKIGREEGRDISENDGERIWRREIEVARCKLEGL